MGSPLKRDFSPPTPFYRPPPPPILLPLNPCLVARGGGWGSSVMTVWCMGEWLGSTPGVVPELVEWGIVEGWG